MNGFMDGLLVIGVGVFFIIFLAFLFITIKLGKRMETYDTRFCRNTRMQMGLYICRSQVEGIRHSLKHHGKF